MYINKFLKGSWLGRAMLFIGDHKKLKAALQTLPSYIGRKGLHSVRESLELMYRYVADILAGKYKAYDRMNLLIIVSALLYVVSPFDSVFDFLPGGLIDDAAIIGWALDRAKSELEKYKEVAGDLG